MNCPPIPSLPTLKTLSLDHAKQKQELAKLKRRYLNLMYRITKSRLAGDDPPNELMKEFADIERTVKYKPKLGGRKRKGPV